MITSMFFAGSVTAPPLRFCEIAAPRAEECGLGKIAVETRQRLPDRKHGLDALTEHQALRIVDADQLDRAAGLRSADLFRRQRLAHRRVGDRRLAIRMAQVEIREMQP